MSNITKDEAIIKAKELNAKVDYCQEMSDAYIFGQKNNESFGGDSPIVVLKTTGEAINMVAYSCMAGTSKVIGEYDI